MATVRTKDVYTTDVDTVFKYLTDPDFLKQRAEAVGARNVQVKVDRQGDTVNIVVKREIRSDAPGPLKKFVPEWSPSVQKETWKVQPGGPYLGKASVEIDGVPVSARSRMKLTANEDGGAVMFIETEFKSNVPMLGGKLASFAAETAKATLKAEYEFNKQHFDA
jgi:hypothetical protein